MPNHARPSGSPRGTGARPNLSDRVRDRVSAAEAALDRGAGSPARLSREVQALRTVFSDLGDTHRRYRRETGAPVSPALRSAAIAFRQEPSLISLLPVAAFLDELGLLPW